MQNLISHCKPIQNSLLKINLSPQVFDYYGAVKLKGNLKMAHHYC